MTSVQSDEADGRGTNTWVQDPTEQMLRHTNLTPHFRTLHDDDQATSALCVSLSRHLDQTLLFKKPLPLQTRSDKVVVSLWSPLTRNTPRALSCRVPQGDSRKSYRSKNRAVT
jgi:hypothetical protein